jgi:hypothetical protein
VNQEELQRLAEEYADRVSDLPSPEFTAGIEKYGFRSDLWIGVALGYLAGFSHARTPLKGEGEENG